MRVLVVGGGGREHSLVWKLARHGHELYCAPGNAGIARLAQVADIDPADAGRLAAYAREKRAELTIVGPEAPLTAGLVDELHRQGLSALGPTAAGARLEGDKVFAKRLMVECGIPTARFETFGDHGPALRYALGRRLPLVVKAAGLAAGKGVVVCRSRAEVEQALGEMMVEARFGSSGRQVVVEEWLEGEEASIIGFCDGRTVRCLAPSQDHKRLRDSDEGPNTGGMGAYAPAPVVTPAVQREVEERVFGPLLAGLQRRGIDYRGVIYAGLMLNGSGLSVLEFNCRLGDPEAQVILPLLKGDLAELALACCEDRLDRVPVEPADRAALCVVAAAEGYPGSYRKGLPVEDDAGPGDDVVVFHAGTRMAGGRVVSAGGRVLGVTGIGDTLPEARDRAYAALGRVGFEGMFYRRDIGARGLARLHS